MKNIIIRSVFAFSCLFAIQAKAQQPQTPQGQQSVKAIQFSGLIVTSEGKEMVAVPFANVYIPGRHVGVTSGPNGFFSIVAEKGEKIIFSAVGFEKATIIIPDTLTADQYSMVQILSRDTVLLAETVIFPWPSREHFKTEFLAMNVTDALQTRANNNLTADALEKVRKRTPHDGLETGSMYLRQQASNYYYYGQTPPMNIFNPFAWGQFFKAWKNGDFNKKTPSTNDDGN